MILSSLQSNRCSSYSHHNYRSTKMQKQASELQKYLFSSLKELFCPSKMALISPAIFLSLTNRMIHGRIWHGSFERKLNFALFERIEQPTSEFSGYKPHVGVLTP